MDDRSTEEERRAAALKLSALLRACDDEALQRFAKMHLPPGANASVDRLRSLRVVLEAIVRTLSAGDEAAWQRVLAAHDALAPPATPSVQPWAQRGNWSSEEPTSVLATPQGPFETPVSPDGETQPGNEARREPALPFAPAEVRVDPDGETLIGVSPPTEPALPFRAPRRDKP